jgi:hypothetical protein
LVSLLARGREPRALLVHVAAGARRELAGVLLARADDLGDPLVGLVEHLAQQERGALLGRQALQQDEEGERQRVGQLGAAGGVVVGVGVRYERLGKPLAHVGLAPDTRRAEVVSASRETTVDRYARGDSIRSPPARARCRRRNPSWTMSSASLTLPSIR